MKADQLVIKEKTVLRLVEQINHNLILVPKLKETMLKEFLYEFRDQYVSEMRPLIEEALEPVEPRTMKIIMEEIAKEGVLTPELLDEIRRSVKK